MTPSHRVLLAFARDVKPVLARCVVCHACYDAPCQLPEVYDLGRYGNL